MPLFFIVSLLIMFLILYTVNDLVKEEHLPMHNHLKEKYLTPFLESQDTQLSPSTIYSKQLYVGQLLDYLEVRSVESFGDFDINLVYEFINTRSEWAPSTVSSAQFHIRSFFDFLFNQGIIQFDGRKVFPVILTNKRARIISFYETEEIKAIVDVIDLQKHNGVRNKCIVLLAAQLGLRSGDIYGLRLSDIKWDKDLIERRQAKTGNWVSLPLPLNLKLLLADYIQNYRPDHNSDFVFISDKTLKPLTVEIIQSIVTGFSKKANIERRGRKMGPHALRHSLVTRLLKGNTPMPVITAILGHKNLNTTRIYLGIDVESLRKISLEVPGNE